MARLFDDGSSQYLTVSSVPVITYPLTFAAWFNVDTNAVYQGILGVLLDTNNYHAIVARGDGKCAYIVRDAAGTQSATGSTPYGTNSWHHIGGVGSSATNRIVYYDGNNDGSNAVSRTPSTPTSTVVGGVFSWYTSGAIAEAAIWNTDLSAGEMAILAKGYSPLFIRPQNLVFYVPLIRDNDEDIVGGLSLTATNSPTISAHPRVFYPSMPILGKSSVAEEAVEEMIIKSKLIRSNQIPIHQLQL